MPKPLNVLLIITDQMRRDHTGCGGNGVIRTPSIDRLAAQGVCLDRAYVSHPVCMPNRSTIATGRLPRNHGCWSNGIDLSESERTIADLLNQQGYHTALLGKAHFRHFNRIGDTGRAEGIECGAAWDEGLNSTDWTGPYYGFQHVELSIAHGPGSLRWAHYGKWIRQHHGAALALAERREPSPTGARQCFTPGYGPEAHCSSWLGGVGSRYLRDRAADGKPFMLWVSFPDPHHPFCPPRPYDRMYDHSSVVMPHLGAEALADKPAHYWLARQAGQGWEGLGRNDFLSRLSEPELREIIARTYGMISLIDRNIGQLLDELDRTGLAENTVVIFTSDHGDLMGDCGLLFKGPFLLEGLINVPMIWRVPGGARGKHSGGLFNSCDIAPTVLELLGLDVPTSMDGLAQASLVADAGRPRRQAAFVEFLSMYRPELRLHAVITADRKLIHYPHSPAGELYDMTAPLPEARNLYAAPTFRADRQRLQELLLNELICTHDKRYSPMCHA